MQAGNYNNCELEVKTYFDLQASFGGLEPADLKHRPSARATIWKALHPEPKSSPARC